MDTHVCAGVVWGRLVLWRGRRLLGSSSARRLRSLLVQQSQGKRWLWCYGEEEGRGDEVVEEGEGERKQGEG